MKAWRRSAATTHPSRTLPAPISLGIASVGGGATVRLALNGEDQPPADSWEWQLKLTSGSWNNPSSTGIVTLPTLTVDKTDIWSSYDIHARARWRYGLSAGAWVESNVLYAPH